MTEQDKKLLLKDLCARLPYGVICHTSKRDGYLCDCYVDKIAFRTEYGMTISAIEKQYLSDSEQDDAVVKPYLRPMSSMTEEERKEFRSIGGAIYHNIQNDSWTIIAFIPEAYDWLNAHHFDYHNLREKGLAIKAPKDMYKTE